ncbi:MAG: NCS2 family permease [Acidobacteria bacterium]|nr:MAG: NCS2 family permease [Acidobacteriota bacterium]REK11499.1 MAG: NCS2 family permease [Acidobacteriota bacterium]
MLERLFHLRRHGTTVGRELRAGLATFLTLSYILFVHPQILAAAGMPPGDVLAATALASALACLVMGLWANLPFALAPGMGLNAYFAYSVVQGLGVSWQVALAAVFVEGVLFLALSLAGFRSAILAAVPVPVRDGTMAGIGLFLAFIGLQNAGLVVAHPATLVDLGPLTSPPALLAFVGILLAAALLHLRIAGGLLLVIVGLSFAAWAGGLAAGPERWISWPSLPSETFLAADLRHVLDLSLIPVILAFLFVDFFDTAGTLMGVGRLAGIEDEHGNLQHSERAFAADAIGTSAGALLGTSTVTTYIESAAGIEEGGRTGLVAVTVAGLFLSALFFAPVFVAVPPLATAPVLVVVGALMMRGVQDIAWRDLADAVPAFLTLAVMPFTFSIAHGIAAGLVSWAVLRLASGRVAEIGWLRGAIVASVVAYYGLEALAG